MKALSQNRRHPLMGLALLLLGLLVTGGLYSVASTVNQAQAATQVTAAASADDITEGEKLFNANCASCHGMGAAGGPSGPSLIGVGAASVDLDPVPASEDFSIIPDALGVPYTFWGLGGFADWGNAPGNHSPAFAPDLQPTLDRAAEAMIVAAGAWLVGGA